MINQYYDLLSDPSILADPDRFKQLTEVIFGRAETDQNPDIIILLREIEKLSNGNMDVKERALELRLKFEKRLKEKGININANLSILLKTVKTKNIS